ncbi:uncharacterized protein LOC130219623 isoform X2 [Danio aesculapii]|uniref:uncharacterized protein LOC130219623 isoform X2 n=1 Tax=Danio aesculapii TaxID=1142201 RepID=UPI0024BF993C|nr:uncharacterized protein LOC130219623 isoform X2 [Danio aesculapii]
MSSYTVVMAPLRNSPTSLDALRFFLWVKKLKDLEREKDLLWMGLQALEQVFPDSLLLSQIHRVNRTLRKLLYDYRNHTDPAIEGFEVKQPSPVYSEESACF